MHEPFVQASYNDNPLSDCRVADTALCHAFVLRRIEASSFGYSSSCVLQPILHSLHDTSVGGCLTALASTRFRR